MALVLTKDLAKLQKRKGTMIKVTVFEPWNGITTRRIEKYCFGVLSDLKYTGGLGLVLKLSGTFVCHEGKERIWEKVDTCVLEFEGKRVASAARFDDVSIE